MSHAGLVLLRQLSDRTGLTAGLSAALPSPGGGLDRGRVFADLACAIADGARVISDFRVMGDQDEVFGQVASVPTAWRTLKEAAAGGDRTRRKVTAAINKARRYAWSQVIARHGQLPPVQVADRQLTGITCIRLDATVVPAHSDKEQAQPNFKGFDLLTELQDVSAAQKVELPCRSVTTLTGMSRSACRGGRDLDFSATESGHSVLNGSPASSSLLLVNTSPT